MTILTFYNNIGLKVSEGENNFFAFLKVGSVKRGEGEIFKSGGMGGASFLKKLEEGMHLRKHCTGLILENKGIRAV